MDGLIKMKIQYKDYDVILTEEDPEGYSIVVKLKTTIKFPTPIGTMDQKQVEKIYKPTIVQAIATVIMGEFKNFKEFKEFKENED